eukprot:NODE_24686_length_614_cov_5.983573.p4 GENE.NODE_24686_length_614_cov_5.983573~~NODE_24686_length_614_cov_5.983573.p4  ORF type:complete len:108 (+),score=37.46 NODE_24686_length_614_cov_5.983573:85-408(+)
MSNMSLAPHPVGVKFWTSIWRKNKDLPFPEVHANFQSWYAQAFHRRFGRYFYAHRAGPMGTVAPIVVFFGLFKVATMYYGTMRDMTAAEEAARAYGQGGYKTNPTPK